MMKFTAIRQLGLDVNASANPLGTGEPGYRDDIESAAEFVTCRGSLWALTRLHGAGVRLGRDD
jgi:hypothetical protein